MRHRLCLSAVALLALLSAARADDRSLIVLFGVTTEETGRVAAHAAAESAHEWLGTEGATLELRRAGLSDGQELTRHMAVKDLEAAFLDSARSGRRTDLVGVLNALDKATYAAAHRKGKRVVLLILDSPAASTIAAMKGGAEELDSRITQTADFCRANSINVAVLEAAALSGTAPAIKKLATATGGAVAEPKTLGSSMLIVAPMARPGSDVAAAPAAAVAASGLPVRTRFIRIQPMRAHSTVSDLGPTSGLLFLECPFNALEFQRDEKGGRFQVQTRMTETVRNAEGKAVWQGKKEVTLKEPAKKLAARQSGSLFYMRTLQLPGGQYTVEATVEDLLAQKSGTASEPLHATDTLPGLGVSDPLFVRPLRSDDRFEADGIFMYDGKAIAPMLDPVFTANEPFELQLYFVIYPDIQGAIPEMSLEILRNGHVEGRSQLAFKDKIKETSVENGTLSGHGEQKHEFPYMADILDATFGAGQYEARVTIRQGRNTVTHGVPFRVVAKKP